MGNESSKQKNEDIVFTDSVRSNMELLKQIFKNDETLTFREIENPMVPSVEFCLVYIDGMVNNKLVNEDVIKPLVDYKPEQRESLTLDILAKQVMLSNSVEQESDAEKILQAIIYGDCILMMDGFSKFLILNTKGWSSRSISEPENEKVLRGPREGFTEALMTNLSLIRRKIRTPDLKMEFESFGTRSNTKACICYLENVVNKDVLADLKKRLESFSIDGTLDVNYLTEFINDAPYSPFKTIGSTEKPDIVAAKLLEGRVALVLDGTPVVLTMPFLFIENFQSDEDYFLNYYFASFGRMLRLLAFFVSTGVPAIYLALTTFHHEILPLAMTMSISQARQGVPFPTVVEAVLMLLVFEMLRESGARMPGMMGQALSIVGALVIGQAAVQAKIVSAPMIIVVAVTGISGLMIPRVKGATILLRFILLGMASILGLYGYMYGMLGLLIHLFNLNSFGIPIMSSTYASTLQDKKDITVRAPWWFMKKRPKYLSPNETREASRSRK
ncbi:spore germination protein [Caproiciproducens faecalis]|uniref:Spore germination protein n=1 Tax=Caproiciproducens faecalis TaxID=2820301 RepID=A0ABS7DJC0_9FIRM|nr:spore germination protein [Caproiciproducens faecalis]MBW7571404.1 spore germination protein [Caproiciproducens faecalis]